MNISPESIRFDDGLFHQASPINGRATRSTRSSGEQPDDFKPMPGIDKDVEEIRIGTNPEPAGLRTPPGVPGS